MFKRFSEVFSKFLFPLLITLIVGYVCWKNYVPGTWLSGWDTLHPEFNFLLYLKRIFFGVWQEHQGVGAVASQAHTSELTRLPIVYLLSLILPFSLVRYAFFFLTLVFGALGVYCFVVKSVGKDSFNLRFASFLAAIFYVFNLATVQQYYIPLEMFAVHFATLPWLFLFTSQFVKDGKRTDLLFFAVTTLLATSMAHTATLFYVYFGVLGIYLLVFSLVQRKWKAVKRGIVIIVVTLSLNLFWLLPNIYYVVRHGGEMHLSNINRIFSDEAFLQSKAFGDIKDLVLLKNFPFNWREFVVAKGDYEDLMRVWQDHLNKSYVDTIGYITFGFAIFGLVVSVFRRNKIGISLFLPFLVSIFFWINSNPPFTLIFDYLRSNFPLFEEGFRFPFTKFSILLVFSLAVYLGLSFDFIFEKLKFRGLTIFLSLLFSACIIYRMLPVFSGYLFDSAMKVSFPKEYFEVFDWFAKNGNSERIAKLPLQTFWGWGFYSWDYQGAGFTWFGIPQPTLDREFDRWSANNESFYNQASFALYSEDLKGFENVLRDFRVGYLLLDESILNAGGSEKLLFIPQIKRMLGESSHITEAAKFGFLTIYKTDFDVSSGFVEAPPVFTKINADLKYSQIDPIYLKYGDYVLDNNAISFPFVNFDKRSNVKIAIEGENIVFENADIQAKVFLPMKDEIDEDLNISRGFKEGYNCDLKKIGSVSKDQENGQITFWATDGGVSCDYLSYPDLPYSQGYVLRVKGENIEGRSLKIYLYNYLTGRMDLEELLPGGKFDELYVVLPKPVDGKGYSLNFETRSYGRVSSKNILEKVEFIPVPIDFLTQLQSKLQTPSSDENNLSIKKVEKTGTSNYVVDVESYGLVALDQGYEEGWQAFSVPANNLLPVERFLPWFFGKKLTHVKINSWANGWLVPDEKDQPANRQIVIIFWPQYLEWGGMILGLVTLIFLFIPAKKKLVDSRVITK